MEHISGPLARVLSRCGLRPADHGRVLRHDVHQQPVPEQIGDRSPVLGGDDLDRLPLGWGRHHREPLGPILLRFRAFHAHPVPLVRMSVRTYSHIHREIIPVGRSSRKGNVSRGTRFGVSAKVLKGLGARIAVARGSLGISQTELAKRVRGLRWAGATQSRVSEWETGRQPPGEAILALQRVLGCNGHWLLTGEGSMEPPAGLPKTPDGPEPHGPEDAEIAAELSDRPGRGGGRGGRQKRG